MRISNASMMAEGSRVGQKVIARKERRFPFGRRLSGRSKAVVLAFSALLLGVLAVALMPADRTAAVPGRTGGNCGGCHPVTPTSFLTGAGFPNGSYLPN